MPQILKLKQKLTLAALAASLVLPAQAQVKMDAAALRGAATTALKAGDSGRAVVYADALLVREFCRARANAPAPSCGCAARPRMRPTIC